VGALDVRKGQRLPWVDHHRVRPRRARASELATVDALDCDAAPPVVVDATGEIFGDVPNVAARAQALAEPGAVVVTARVQRQVAGLFVAEDQGIHDLKGVPEPVTLYRVVRASGGGRRAGQRHLTPLVGRDEEKQCLCGAGSGHAKATGN
jgi:class 3 adenylate cyclase